MKHYVIHFVSDLRQASGFAAGTPVSSTIRAHRHDVAELLLNTITLLFLFFMPVGNPRWPPPQDRLTLAPMGKYSNAFYSETTS
jgi:hypothetical protein